MYLIIKLDSTKYWTEEIIQLPGGTITFKTRTKDGKILSHQMNKKAIEEIIDVGEVESTEALDKDLGKSKM